MGLPAGRGGEADPSHTAHVAMRPMAEKEAQAGESGDGLGMSLWPSPRLAYRCGLGGSRSGLIGLRTDHVEACAACGGEHEAEGEGEGRSESRQFWRCGERRRCSPQLL